MKKKLYSHPDVIIATLAFVLLCTLAAFYSWATDAIITQLHRSLVSVPPQTAAGFNLDGASKLDLRGLLVQPPSATDAPPLPASLAPATAPTTTKATGTAQ